MEDNYIPFQGNYQQNDGTTYIPFQDGIILESQSYYSINGNDKPKCEYAGLMEIFTLTMETEKSTTKALQDLYRMVMTEGDFLTAEFLLPMLKEQVEEEDKVQTVLDFIKIAGLQPPGLAMIDNKVGELA